MEDVISNFVDKRVLEFISAENAKGVEPDSVGIASHISTTTKLTIDFPLMRMERLKANGFVKREERAGGFNGHNWHTITPQGVTRLNELTELMRAR